MVFFFKTQRKSGVSCLGGGDVHLFWQVEGAAGKKLIVFISLFVSLLTSCLQHFDIFLRFLKSLQLSLSISILEIYSTYKNRSEFIEAACLYWLFHEIHPAMISCLVGILGCFITLISELWWVLKDHCLNAVFLFLPCHPLPPPKNQTKSGGGEILSEIQPGWPFYFYVAQINFSFKVGC